MKKGLPVLWYPYPTRGSAFGQEQPEVKDEADALSVDRQESQ